MATRRYLPGGAPAISSTQARRVDAMFAWEARMQKISGQGCDLLTAGRVAEFAEFDAAVIAPHKQAKPSWI